MAQIVATGRRQRGLYTVEFAIAGGVFLVALFMVIEFARALYSWNLMEEVTRRGARLAAVCPVTPAAETEAIRQSSVDIAGGTLPGFTTANVTIAYLDEDGGDVGDPVTNFGDIRFVRASIANYQYQAIFPLDRLIPTPSFEITLPAESLGITPPDTGTVTCT